MNKQRLNIRVTGKVQGVFYRANTEKKALEFGLAGWVRNLSDGRVEIEAEGEKEQLDKLVAWCRQGPSEARVEGLEVKAINVLGGNDFSIRS